MDKITDVYHFDDAFSWDVKLFLWLILAGYLLVILGLCIRVWMKIRNSKIQKPTEVGKSYSTWKKPTGSPADKVRKFKL